MFQIMPALCPHGQGEGERGGGGWSTKSGQAWTGEVGVPKIPWSSMPVTNKYVFAPL